MTDENDQIAHLFADYGTEAEALSTYGDVYRFTLDPQPNDYVTETVEMDLTEFIPTGRYGLAVLHPPCTRWSDMPDVDHDEHPDLISRAREIGEKIADHYVIENKPAAPLNNPTVLDGRMFGLPIKYERAFETSFKVRQPPRNARLTEPAETSPFYYSERSHEWWKGVKGLRGNYPKQHIAKNALPMPYVDHIARSWIEATGAAGGVSDYSNYDAQMEKKRAKKNNRSLEGFQNTQ